MLIFWFDVDTILRLTTSKSPPNCGVLSSDNSLIVPPSELTADHPKFPEPSVFKT